MTNLMRQFCLLIAWQGFISIPAFAQTEVDTRAQNQNQATLYVTPERGLRVRAEADPQAPVLTTLWQGARVFVRDREGAYVRIDGFGVAGYAFVETAYLSAIPVAPNAEAPAPAH